MDVIYVQYTHIFKHVKIEFYRGENRRFPWRWILAFTLGIANLNMTVRQDDPGVAVY
jgi:hypothetical protein